VFISGQSDPSSDLPRRGAAVDPHLPRHPTLDAFGQRVVTNPTVYILDEDRGVCQLRTDALRSTTCPQEIDLAFLREAIANRMVFTPISDADRRTLRASELPHINTRTRLALWRHEVLRQRARPDRGLDSRMVAESARYFDDMTWQVVEPLIEEGRQVERRLIRNFLRPLLEKRLQRRVARRATAAECQRYREQAVDTYPFLKDLWHRDPKIESPDANSLTGLLEPADKQLLRRAIDDGQPLAELLLQLLNLEPWMLTHLRLHWTTFRAYDRSEEPDRQWDMASKVALFTPETAPTQIEELQHLRKLTERMDRSPTPIVPCLATTMTPSDQRQLKAVLGSTSKTSLLLEYLEFLYSVNAWVSKCLGQNHYVELPALLGVRTFGDWWTLARRWRSRNKKVYRQGWGAQAANGETIDLSWPPLLTQVEQMGSFSFTSRSSYSELRLESKLMYNCARHYVSRCAFADSHLLHIARNDEPVGTVEVRKEMYGDNPKILLVDAQSHDYKPLDTEAQGALTEFLEACNDGLIRLNPAALQPRSVHADALSKLLDAIPMDYSHWERSGLEMHYFDLYAESNGVVMLENYRDALEVERGSSHSLYKLALCAVRRNKLLQSDTREYLKDAVIAY